MANRTHMTNENFLDLKQQYFQGKHEFKPNGLWYSINREWLEWCESEMPDWKKQWLFYLYPDVSDVLIISTIDDLNTFANTYTKKIDKYLHLIDWWKVARTYTGIEFQNYHHLKYADRSPDAFNRITWFWAWDVNGGCIWNVDIIKKLRRYKING